jgi:hypothetical protein
LVFAPGTAAMVCPYCGNEQHIEIDDTPVLERSFDAARLQQSLRPASEVVHGVQVRCEGCGAIQSVEDQSTHCAFCDSPVVIEQDDPQVIVPESLLPFAVDAESARGVFDTWLKKRWFAPSDLAKRSRRSGMDGVYIPYWTYDTFATTSYTGQRGEHYYETEYYTDSEGNRQSRQVQKTRWYPASGTVHNAFDDVLICASESLPRKLVAELEPWDLESLVPYEGGFLSGFRTERYRVGLEDGFERATERMSPVIHSSICSDIGGDVQRVISQSTQYGDKTFKHLLLPLWISSFRYGDRVFRVLVNARTGEVQGERPWSVAKIALFVLAIAVVVGAIYLWVSTRPAPYPDDQEYWDGEQIRRGR